MDSWPVDAWNALYPANSVFVDDSCESIYPEFNAEVPSYLVKRDELTTRARENLEVLALRQGVGVFVPQVPGRTDHWPPDESVDEFLATIRQSRVDSPPWIRL